MATTKSRLLTVALSLAVAISGIFSAVFYTAPTVKADGESAKEILPVAKYEFKDENNIGKDSMGNFDLTFRNEWKADGTGPLLNEFTMLEGGGISFDKKLCLAADIGDKDVVANTSALTLVAVVKASTSASNWGHIAGVGYLNNAGKSLSIASLADSAVSQIGAYSANSDYSGIWNQCTVVRETENFHTVILSAQPGGKFSIFVDGALIDDSKTLAADWSAHSGNHSFSIGGEFNGNGAWTTAASLKNVTVYNFAMSETAATAYYTNGKVTADDLSGVKTATKAEIAFEGDATNVALNMAMTTDEMFAALNPATATLTLTDETTATANVKWTKVVKEEDKYYAVGTLETGKLGIVDLVGEVNYELSVASVKAIGEPVFADGVATEQLKDSMTQAEMLEKLNQATVTVTLSDESTVDVTVTFTKIEANLGEYTAYGDVVVNGTTVATASVKLNVEQTNEGIAKELVPVAKWTFDTEETKLQDSMGKYTLQNGAISDGDRENKPTGTGTVQNGMLYVDGTDMLTLPELNDVSENIYNGFTLNFQVKQDGDISGRPNPGEPGKPAGEWAAPVSFSFNDWVATTYCRFLVATSGGGDMLRFNAHNITLDDKGASAAYWGPAVVDHIADKMHNITLSIRPGEYAKVYADGVEVISLPCPEGWNLKHQNMQFAIGGECVWGNGYDYFKGWIDNVSIYNFAMSESQVGAYWQKGKVTVGDMTGDIITEVDSVPHFEQEGVYVNEKGLNDTLTATQFVDRLLPATVNAKFDGVDAEGNAKTVALAVAWKTVKLESDGKYYAIGEVDATNLGYATLLTGKTQVRQEVTVEKRDRKITVDPDIENGTVTVDKTAAKLNEQVKVTVKANDGYVLKELTVGDVAVEVGEDGTYTFTVTGNREVKISATFEEEQQPESGCGSCNSSVFASSGLVVLAMAAAVILKKKKDN